LLRLVVQYLRVGRSLCLGHKADVIKNYFRSYDECVSNDFVLSLGGKNVELFSSDIDDWSITFVDTGLSANIGQRLKAVEKHSAERGGIPRQLQRWALRREPRRIDRDLPIYQRKARN
jgi:hypothetical protein